MIEDFWKDKYPAGIAADINPDEYPNIQAVLKQSCQRFANKPAFSNLGKTLTYGELYELSGAFAAYLQQHTDLQPGDRIAVQLPNVLQYPVAVFGAIRAGLIVVNTNPLYTAREMEHQFNDSGAKALVCLANMAHLAEAVVPKTGVKHVIVTEVADLLPPLKRLLINSVIKYVKKMVPAYHLPKAIKFNDVLSKGHGQPVAEASPDSGDVAVLQYTGGTTGVAKGAMLTHRNLVANMLQCKALMGSNLNEGCEILITPLPLYHIYAFTFHCMAMMLIGNHNILISNPRDLPAMVKELSKWKFSGFVGLNTLFVALCNNEGFRKLDFSALKVTLSGGMALQLAAAERWWQQLPPAVRSAIDYLEEPLADSRQLPLLHQACGLPYAWDESLCQHWQQRSLPASCPAGLAALVVKPMVVGGEAAVAALANIAADWRITLVLSSALEASIGLCEVARLAAIYSPDQTAGLDTWQAFGQDLLQPLAPGRQVLALSQLQLRWSGP